MSIAEYGRYLYIYLYIIWTLVTSSITGGYKMEALGWKIELIGVASGKKNTSFNW